MARSASTLRIDPRGDERVTRRDDGIWVEVDHAGAYSEVSEAEEVAILEQLRHEPWRAVVTRHFAERNPWLYQIITHPARSLCLDVLPIPSGGAFLDVGSGWGQVAVPLSRHGDVFALELTLRRVEILREITRQEDAPLHYVCGSFNTFPFAEAQFDLILFNGSLEWIHVGGTDDSIAEAQRAALRKAFAISKPGGVVYIAIENAIGLKYLLGAPDDHSGVPHLTFLDESEARAKCAVMGRELCAKTWSLVEYLQLIEGSGFSLVETYGCFPDYKLPQQLIPLSEVNANLSMGALLGEERSGSDGAGLEFAKILPQTYRRLAKNGIAQYFCPSYAFVARK